MKHSVNISRNLCLKELQMSPMMKLCWHWCDVSRWQTVNSIAHRSQTINASLGSIRWPWIPDSLKRVPVPLSAWSCRHVWDWMSERESRESGLCFPEIAAAGGGGWAGGLGGPSGVRMVAERLALRMSWRSVWVSASTSGLWPSICPYPEAVYRTRTYRVSRRDFWDVADCMCFSFYNNISITRRLCLFM